MSDEPQSRLREWSKRELRREVKRLRPLALHAESQYAQCVELQRQVEHLTQQKGLVADRNTQLRSALLRSRSSLDEARRILDAVLGPANQGGIDGTDRLAAAVRRRPHRRTPGAPVDPNIAG